MSIVTKLRCDSCGKLAELTKGDLPPKGWRLNLPLPFPDSEVRHNTADVCSPGCAKNVINTNIDLEWEGENGIPVSVVPSANPSEGPESTTEGLRSFSTVV